MPTDVLYMVPNTAPGLMLDEGGDGLTYIKELIYTGNFVKSTKEGEQEFTVDEQKINHWAHTGNRMLNNGVKVPFPLKHTDNPEATRARMLSYTTGLNDDGIYALFGKFRFRDAEAAKLAKTTDVSIFVPADPFVDGRGNKYEYAIKHVAFTDHPVIPGLSDFKAIAASYDSEISLSDQLLNPTTRNAHLLHAAGHGAIGYLEYKHTRHLATKLATRIGRHYASGGLKQVGASVLRKGVRGAVGRYVAPVALGVLGAHGLYHGTKAIAKSLHSAVKAPKAPHTTALSLAFNKNQERASDGKWTRRLASGAIGGAAVGHAVKAVARPLFVVGVHHFGKKAGVDAHTLHAGTKVLAKQAIAPTLTDAAYATGLGAVARRVGREPSQEHEAPKTTAERSIHAAKALAKLAVAGHLIGHALKHGIDAVNNAHATRQFFKVAQLAGHSTRSEQLAIHALTTRPAALAAIASTAAALGIAHGAKRAYRSSKRNMRAVQAVEASLSLSENPRVNIYEENRQGNGRFGHKPAGHSSTREMHGLRKQVRYKMNSENKRVAYKDKYYIRDHSDEQVHSGDRTTALLQAAKHATLGTIEGGVLYGAAHGVVKQGLKSGKTVWNSRTASGRVNAIKSLAAHLAGAATASGIVHRRVNAIHTHLKTAFNRAD